MENKDLATMIADEVTKAIAPLHERLDRITASNKQEIPVPEEPFNFRACYERTGRIEKTEIDMRKELTFIPNGSYEVVRGIIKEHHTKLERIRKVLTEKGEGLAEAIEYQKKGAAWQRKKVLAECESWMNETNCPQYLREEYRQKAYSSCDNEYISKIATAFYGLKLDLETEVEINSEGEWQVAQKIADEMLESHRYTLTPEEAEAFGLYKELLAIAKKLHDRNYFITASFAGEDCLYPLDSEEEDMQQFLTYYREPKKK